MYVQCPHEDCGEVFFASLVQVRAEDGVTCCPNCGRQQMAKPVLKPILVFTQHDSGYQGYYRGGQGGVVVCFGRRCDDDPFRLLTNLANHFPDGFVAYYGGELSQADLERDFG